jgi:glycosyltransferase involved in cell wall biosynthesis
MTGSGITLDATVRNAAQAGWKQAVLVGLPEGEALPNVGGLAPEHVHTLRFGNDALPFDLPGMSDIMPYASTVFSSMSDESLQLYRRAWYDLLVRAVGEFKPDLIHSHHVWLLSSMVKDVLAELGLDIPVITHCHATGLRQMVLPPNLADDVVEGCARNDAFVVLHRQHAEALHDRLGVAGERVHVVGAGYRADLFKKVGHPQGDDNDKDSLLYVGKFSAAKGLPELLDAFEVLQRDRPALRLHIAGSAASAEGDALRGRMENMSPNVILHGALSQIDLAALMRRCGMLVLPSLYEGLPLVLVEAYASGCKLVATALPGVVEQLEPHLGEALELIPLPKMIGIDRADPAALPHFSGDIVRAIERSLDAQSLGEAAKNLQPLTWHAVFQRIEAVWNAYLA